MVMNKAICNRYYETTCSAILRNILHLPYVLGIFLVSLLAAARHEVLRARIAGKGKAVIRAMVKLDVDSGSRKIMVRNVT